MEDLIIKAQNGDTDAMGKLAHYFFTGNDTGKILDITKSLEWAKKGAELGNVNCMMQFALVMSINVRAMYRIAPGDVAEKEIENMKLALEYAQLANDYGRNVKINDFKAQLAQLYFQKYLNSGNKEFLSKAEELIYEGYPYEITEYNELYALILAQYKDELNEEEKQFYQKLLYQLVSNHMEELRHPDTCCYYLGIAFALGCGCDINYNSAYLYLSMALERGVDCSETLDLFHRDEIGNWYID